MASPALGMPHFWLVHEEEKVTLPLGNVLRVAQQNDPGPAFLPSEHDELPPGVAFMVCQTL
jgi:hypothetical protein